MVQFLLDKCPQTPIINYDKLDYCSTRFELPAKQCENYHFVQVAAALLTPPSPPLP